ncbi:MAG: antibiotic biosynthesis monooxygenase [Corynebacterium sp.]|uniref:putative quinol monooxygenase n=1 Tax=Corynebacterium sp. TaxID=1720 RepID=UPI0026DACAFB|nr:antibiotic biosynthesis monooxygenase [Corynebacterium sp.]MDO4761634.1 antibiotic biosynthesis monooxygenase [Corynebacterium sp.]
MIRMLLLLDAAPPRLAEELPQLREQSISAELYRSIMPGENSHALILGLDSEEQAGAFITNLSEFPATKAVFTSADMECYQQQNFQIVSNVWTPDSQPNPALAWPSRGKIRILIQGCYQPNPDMVALTAQEVRDTRREPGCEQYTWFENVELKHHWVLLELWSDQQIYDAHWFGRVRSVEYRGDSGRVPATPHRGAVSREFYRQQVFAFRYGRVEPATAANLSHTIVWPNP